jgi:hypothetical protein
VLGGLACLLPLVRRWKLKERVVPYHIERRQLHPFPAVQDIPHVIKFACEGCIVSCAALRHSAPRAGHYARCLCATFLISYSEASESSTDPVLDDAAGTDEDSGRGSVEAFMLASGIEKRKPLTSCARKTF